MRLSLTGEIVETEKRPWTLKDGTSGTSYNLYVRHGSVRDGATRVKVQPEQYGAFGVGDELHDVPVDVYARANDVGNARLDVVLDREYVHSKGLHGVKQPQPA